MGLWNGLAFLSASCLFLQPLHRPAPVPRQLLEIIFSRSTPGQNMNTIFVASSHSPNHIHPLEANTSRRWKTFCRGLHPVDLFPYKNKQKSAESYQRREKNNICNSLTSELKWPGTWHTGSNGCCPHCCSDASKLKRGKNRHFGKKTSCRFSWCRQGRMIPTQKPFVWFECIFESLGLQRVLYHLKVKKKKWNQSDPQYVS